MAKRHHGGHYEGMDSRRKQEMEDAGMIREDHSAIANLPQEVMMKPYPKDSNYMPEDLDDTLRGIDKQMNADSPMKHKIFKEHKY